MKKILMCSPDYYDVTYKINPWMDKSTSVDRSLAKKQWLDLKYLIEAFFEIETEVIKQRPKLPDMVFSADCGLMVDNTFIQANFSFEERIDESKHYRNWFEKNGYKVIGLPRHLNFEGGDFLLWGDKMLAGYGFRTKKAALSKVAKITNREVIGLELTDPFLYHLDLAAFPLDEQTLVYYPSAFSLSSQKKIKSLGKRLIEVSRKDALNLTLNSIVHDKKIITKQGINGLLVQLVKEDFKVIQTDVSEFKKAGGGIHCLTCYLN